MRSATQFRKGDMVTVYRPGDFSHGEPGIVRRASPGFKILVMHGNSGHFYYPSELLLDPITRLARLAGT